MTNEEINEIAIKFNIYCGIAGERYEGPKYVFAALLTMLDYLEEMEHLASEEQKEFIKTDAELTKDVSNGEISRQEEEEKSSETISAPSTILGVVPKTGFEKTILEDLVNLGCESLEDIKWIRATVDKGSYYKKYYVMVKSRLARLPGSWNDVAVSILSSMMRKKNLTLAIQDSPLVF